MLVKHVDEKLRMEPVPATTNPKVPQGGRFEGEHADDGDHGEEDERGSIAIRDTAIQVDAMVITSQVTTITQ